jgi:hypothetical protein
MESVVNTAATFVSVSSWWTELQELLRSVGMEVAMFGLAALLYLVSSGHFTKIALKRKADLHAHKAPISKIAYDEKEQPLLAVQQSISRALRAVDLDKALGHGSNCKKISNGLAVRLLTALSECPCIEEKAGE